MYARGAGQEAQQGVKGHTRPLCFLPAAPLLSRMFLLSTAPTPPFVFGLRKSNLYPD